MIYSPLNIPKIFSVNSAISLMSQLGQSSILVVEDSSQDEESVLPSSRKPEKISADALLGIFTQSDVVTLVATGRLYDRNLTIAEVMKSPVILLDLSELVPEGSELSPDLTKGLQSLSDSVQQLFISQALSLYEEHKIHHLPIVDPEKNIIGLMTYEHLMKWLIGFGNDSLKNIVNIQSPGETIQKSEGNNFLTCPPLEGTILHRGSAIGVRGDRQGSDDNPDGKNPQPNLKSLAIKSLGNLEICQLIADENCLLLVIDRQGIILLAEGKILVNGWAKQNLLGSNFFDLTLPDLAVRQQLHQILQTGKNCEELERLSNLFLSENDDGKFYKFKYLPVTNSQDELLGVLCVVTDITKKQTTEAELRSLFRAMTDLVLVLDREGRYLSIAPTKTNLLYKPPRELLGKTLPEIFPPETAAVFLSQIHAALETQETIKFEYLLLIQGKEVWFDARISPFLEDSAIVVARDISDRIKSEQELKQSQQFLQQILNAIPAPIFVKDERHQFILVNDAFCELIGHEREAVIGKSDPDFFPPEQVEVFWQIDARVLETGLPYQIEEQVTDSCGNLHVVSTKKSRVEDEKQHKFLIGTSRDVTEQVKIAEELKLSEERYRAFIAQSSEGICCCEFAPPISLDQPELEQIQQIFRNGYIAECNDLMAKMYGLGSASEAIGKPVRLWRSALKPENMEKLRDLIRSGYRLKLLETKWGDAPETCHYFLHNIIGIIEAGCLQRLWVTQLDITDRRIAQIALEKSEARYRGIIESQQDLIMRIDTAGRLTFVNDACCGKFGRSASQLLGQHYLALVYEEDQTMTLQVMEMLNAPPYRVSLENRAVTAQGCRWIAWEYYAIQNEQRTTLEIQAVGRDISDRKETELALRETENFLELFFCQSIEGFFFMMLDSPVEWNDTVDKEKVLDYVFAHQRVTKVNDAMLAQYQATREEFIGRTLNDLFAHNLAYGREILRPLFDNGKLELISDERDMNGNQIWIEGEYICLYDDQGRITGHFGVQRDISDRYRAEAALRESEQRFRQIAENSHEIFWIATDDRQKMLYVNPAYEIISGYSCHSLYKDPLGWIDKIIHPDDRYRVLGTIMQQILDPHEISHEYRIVRPDGTIRWLWERIFPIGNEAGEIYRQAGLISDITLRKEIEETLRVTQERLGYLITTNPAVIYSLEPWGNCRTTFISDNVKTLLGYEPEEFFQQPDFWIQHIHPDDRDRMTISIESEWHPDKTISHEYRFRTALGQYRWMRDEHRLILDDRGNPLEVVGYLADITERKQAEEEIRKSIQKERELNALKSRFITMTSHEFRTPLATILSSADLLEVYVETGAVEKSSQHIERIQSAAEHLTNMLNDILEIAHAETRQQDFQPAAVDLAAFCREIIAEINIRYSHQRSISFICTSESEEHLSAASVDTILIRQILVNLLSNALKYSAADAQVELELIYFKQILNKSSNRLSKMAILQVKDTGFGIAPEEQERIFDAFYRGNNITNIPGTGLGLAIVKHAVDLHGGKITVESQQGVGTTFTVTLPLS